jgi:hypothetical protein
MVFFILRVGKRDITVTAVAQYPAPEGMRE